MTDADAVLARYLTPDECLGPIDAERIRDREALAALYDNSNRIHNQRTLRSAPFVIGRKGAGKTAFISAVPDGHPLVIRLPKADIYQGVLGLVKLFTASGREVYVEHVERIWHCLVWGAALWKLAGEKRFSSYDGHDRIELFVLGIGDDRMPHSEEEMITRLLTRYDLRIRQTSALAGIGDLMAGLQSNGLTLQAAIDDMRELTATTGVTPIVIMDSLERYNGPINSILSDSESQLVFAGLFRFLGSSNDSGRTLDLRFAFPAELWHLLRQVSTAPVKDFSRTVLAHWSARELLVMSANRLALFLRLQNPDLLVLRPTGGSMSYGYAKEQFGRLLPIDMRNSIGIQENTLAYLLRHTQLLPRHFIHLVNSIVQEHFRRTGTVSQIPAATVLLGVRNAESLIREDILSAYSRVHPQAGDICRALIRNLDLVFTSDELHSQYVKSGVRNRTGVEFNEAVRVLTEIGAVGRVVGDHGRYIEGEFEYTRPNQLIVGSGERLCLHPVFAETFDSRVSSSRWSQLSPAEQQQVRPVYPYGADPDEPDDYRDR